MPGCKTKVVRQHLTTGDTCGYPVYEDGKCEFHYLLDNGVPLRAKRKGESYSQSFARLCLAVKKNMKVA